MLIASYGLGRFIKEIENQKEKILFFTSFIVAHSLYVITFFDQIYFPNTNPWVNPMPVSSQLALNDPLVHFSSMFFVMIFVLIYIRTKTTIYAKTR